MRRQSNRQRRFSESMSRFTVLLFLEKTPNWDTTRGANNFRPFFSRGSLQFLRVCKPADLPVRGWCVNECESGSNLGPILPIVPFHGLCLVFARNVDVFKPSETLVVGREDDMVFARSFNADAVVGK